MSNSEHYTEVSKFSNDFYDNIYTNFKLNRQVTFNKLRFFDRIIYFCNMQSINQNFTMDIGTRDFYNQYTNLQQFGNYKSMSVAYLINWFCNNYEIFKVIVSIFNDNYTFISTNEHKILLNTHPLFGIATYIYTLNDTLYKIYNIWKFDYEYFITNNNDNLKIIHKSDFLKLKFNITNSYLLMTDFLYNINKDQLLRDNLQQFYEGNEDNYKYFFELYNYLIEYINSIVKKESCKKIIQILEKINQNKTIKNESCKKIIKILRKKYICKKNLLEKEVHEKEMMHKCDINITTTKIAQKDYVCLLVNCLDTIQDYDIAKALHNKYGNRFICALPKKNIWYELVNNKWCLSENGTSLMRLISEDFINDFLILVGELNLKTIKLCGSEKEDARNKASRIQKICDRLLNITFKKQIMKHATYIFYKEDFYEINIAEKIIKKYKKKPIPPPLKRNVWHKYIGEDIGKAKCLCCKLADITQMSFHCGHIIAESKGGELSVNNLKPICQSCNSSMGTQNMDKYIEKYGF